MSGEPIRLGTVSSRAALAAVKQPLARLRARLRVVKSAALFLLPLPLLIVIVGALVADETERFMLAAGALACFWAAGVLTWRALTGEMRYVLGDQVTPDGFPRKLLSAVLTTVGAALAAVTVGHSPIGVGTFAALGGIGHCCFYGLDMRAARMSVTRVDGLDVTGITQQLEQADLRLRRIDAAARAIAVPEFRTRLARITAISRQILAEIARDPRNAARARRFLSLFLDSAERITRDYSRSHQGTRNCPLEEHFRTLLIDMEHTFSEQHRTLLENDEVSLDAEMEVLKTRLRRGEAGTRIEK